MIKLYLGDCLDVLPVLEVGSIDVIITDPPFNVGKSFDNDKLSSNDFRAFCNRYVLEMYRLRPLNVLIEVGKGDLIVRQELERYFEFRYSICLNYTNSMRNGTVGFANFGLILWFSNGGKCYKRYKDRLDSALHSTKDQFTHPSPKEVIHYSKLVEMFSQDNMTILDPFMGSGTTGIACKQLGRSFVGIENNSDYYAIAKQRITDAKRIEVVA